MIVIIAPVAGLIVAGVIAATVISNSEEEEEQPRMTNFEEPRVMFWSKVVGHRGTLDNVVNLNDKNFFLKLKKDTGVPTVVLFYWKSCGPCKRFMPYWNALVQVLSGENRVNLIALERDNMDNFFANKGKAGGSVYQFPTMRILNGVKKIAAYNNDSTNYPPPNVIQQIAMQHDVEEISVENPEKLFAMLQFVDESI